MVSATRFYSPISSLKLRLSLRVRTSKCEEGERSGEDRHSQGIAESIEARIEEMAKKIEDNEKAGKEKNHYDQVKKAEHGSSGLPMGAPLANAEKSKMDEEAELLAVSYQDDFTTRDYIESMYTHLTQEVNDVKEDVSDLRALVSNELKAIKDDLGSMTLTLSAILTKISQPSPITQSVSTPRTPRVIIAPRSQYRTPNSIDRPSHKRDRSRSPIVPRTTPNFKTSHTSQIVKCTFCSSVCHLSRNCTIVTSVSTRISLMSPIQCHRCFRHIGPTHSASCEPEICTRECSDELGRGLRHMQFFCPRNPDLQP
ncbi:hypothetical protein PMAYCL1PPCAC_26098 [Pristionchus mayeri]|uniref:Uncharacterized protein n=1 Tax=Pristionchus mayeri TaxID=1317129 RepID=A0AAN5I7Z2_9BILA|nr:hypothetical protein PMAYCL1PPCAC_26098 [Pristionchus mayeri]